MSSPIPCHLSIPFPLPYYSPFPLYPNPSISFPHSPTLYSTTPLTPKSYYQPVPQATSPFPPITTLNDPDFGTFCAGKSATCYDAWGLRILDSQNILVYGAGFYSFFNDYSLSMFSPPLNHVSPSPKLTPPFLIP